MNKFRANTKQFLRPTALAITLLVTGLLSGGVAEAGTTLDSVRANDLLRCGVSTGLQGFSQQDKNGRWNGIDAAFCRAVATAILGDPEKVAFIPVTAKERFKQLQEEKFDLLSRNTTWTSSRDSSLNSVFAGTLFYDGQGFMIHKSLGYRSVRQLNGTSICVQAGTTTQLNLVDYFHANNMTYTPMVEVNFNDVQRDFLDGKCQVYTSDISSLAATRQQAKNPNDYIILPEAISKEPLGPMVRRGDWEFFTIVKWVLFGLIEAEEEQITSANVENLMANSHEPHIKRMLGVEGDVGKGLGLDNQWLVNVVKAIGNYGELYSQHISPLGVPRGLNAQWTDGGLMYAPPVR